MSQKRVYFRKKKKSADTPFFSPLILVRKWAGGDGAGAAFKGWFISTGGELQPWWRPSSNIAGIYQYLVTLSWLVFNFEGMSVAENVSLCTSGAAGNNLRQTAGVSPHTHIHTKDTEVPPALAPHVLSLIDRVGHFLQKGQCYAFSSG